MMTSGGFKLNPIKKENLIARGGGAQLPGIQPKHQQPGTQEMTHEDYDNN